MPIWINARSLIKAGNSKRLLVWFHEYKKHTTCYSFAETLLPGIGYWFTKATPPIDPTKHKPQWMKLSLLAGIGHPLTLLGIGPRFVNSSPIPSTVYPLSPLRSTRGRGKHAPKIDARISFMRQNRAKVNEIERKCYDSVTNASRRWRRKGTEMLQNFDTTPRLRRNCAKIK